MLVIEKGGLCVDLMDLDDIAVRVVEKDLMPFLGGRVPIVGILHAFCLKMRLERFDVISAIRDVPPFNGIYRVPRFEPDA